MELFLLQAVAFLRPIFFINYEGGNLFDSAAIGGFVLLLAAFLINASIRKDLHFSGIDIIILFFSAYCIAVSLIYADKANGREVAKLLIPMLTYIIAKNVIRDVAAYKKILGTMIVGFVAPIVLRTWLIASGSRFAVDLVDFWSGIERWQGVYAGAHSMAHNVTFLLMLITIYFIVPNCETESAPRNSRGKKILVLPLAIMALYCLYESQVRTTVLGLAVFVVMLLYRRHKKVLITISIVLTLVTIAALPVLTPRFFYDIEKVESGEWAPTELGSGRPRIWKNNTDRYFALPPDRFLVGAGIGNKVQYGGTEGFWDSHNDILDVFIQTGFVGFGLFMTLQFFLLKKILRLPGTTKPLFLAVFIAVVVMNLVSSSYVNRFGLAQMYYILLSYIEIQRRQEEGLRHKPDLLPAFR